MATFDATYINSKGEDVSERRPEEHIELTDAWRTWLTEQRTASKITVLRARKNFAVTAEQLSKCPDDFELYGRMRQEELIRKEKEAADKGTSTSAPAGKPKAKPRPKTSAESKIDATNTARSGDTSVNVGLSGQSIPEESEPAMQVG